MPEPNQKQAMIQAGSKQRGNKAESYASITVRKPKVKAYLNYLKDKSTNKAILSKAKVLKEISKLAFTNIKDYVTIDEDGNEIFIPFDQIDEDKLAAVKSIKVRKNKTVSKKGTEYQSQTTEFDLYSKDSALDKLMKHFGLYKEDNDQKRTNVQIALVDMIAYVGGLEG